MAIAACIALVACRVDPLGLSKREVAAGYILERVEQNYFLTDSTHAAEVGGVIGGVVLAIGWNEQKIAVERHTLFDGKPDGIVIIDLTTRTTSEPMARAQLAADSQLRGIDLVHAAKAWESLLTSEPK
jgi:hypothetical protein